MTGISEAPSALERGRPVLLVTPPAVEHAESVWELLAPDAARVEGNTPHVPSALIVCGDTTAAEDWADAAPASRQVHPVTALERSARLLHAGAVDILAGTPEALHTLATRSALRLDAVSTLVLAWPEWLQASGRGAPLEQLLSELRGVRRVVLAWDPAALEDLLERHARRPHVVGDLPLGDDGLPLTPVGAARYAVILRSRRPAVRREILDAVDRPRVTEWRRGMPPEPADAIVCFDLPSRPEFAAISAVGAPVLLLSPEQIPYARTIARPLTPLPLQAAWGSAEAGAERIRTAAAARIDAGGLEPVLALLQPLLARYDAAEVAAAVLAIGRQQTAATQQPTPDASRPAWVRLFVNVGRRDKVGPKDLVGALTRELGLSRETLGRIEVKDSFSLMNVAPEVAEQALHGLARVTIRGRRVSARRDREA